MSSMKHSAAPWVLHTVESDTGNIKHLCPVDDDGFSLLTIVEHDGTKFAAVYRDEDARRIVACANALEHISTEDLESGRMQNLAVQLADAERARDRLLAALKTAQAGLVWYQDMHPEHVDGSDDEAMNEIAEAIAAAEQLKPQLQPPKGGD